MMKPVAALIALSTLASPAALTAADTASSKRIVTAFYDLAFVKHRPAAAARAYLGTTYIQHNPHVPNGAAPFSGYFTNYFARHPRASSRIVHVVAEGDLVVVHSHGKSDGDDAGQAIVDIFRVDHGKIVEHWDVMQTVVAGAPNGNTMFDGTNGK